jgi:hypothetical protein
MGKAVQGINPITCRVASRPGLDVERLKGEALRVYLQYRLHELEQHIASLSVSGEIPSDAESDAVPHTLSSQEDDWELMLDLGYLYASRDAIVSALSIL